MEKEVLLTPIPGFPDYIADCINGRVYSKLSNKYLLQNARGTGDNNKYLMTSLRDSEGKYHHMYLHEIIMSSHLGIMKKDWREAFGQPLEVNHRSKDTKDCSIQNLELTSSKGNKATKDMVINKVRLSMEIAEQIREEFKTITKNKIDWYKSKGSELGVTFRSIQNICLGNTYKVVTND
ncbi:hypothetical protein [Rossellomorea sp. BNER]|uniref:hypothetical protein n=1 Tax=Rossellomorea sp. BNER TaxID=2962031 RepID=UPI003AF2A947|nr:hypothetical protein [Rossellomorea sp. BNER]